MDCNSDQRAENLSNLRVVFVCTWGGGSVGMFLHLHALPCIFFRRSKVVPERHPVGERGTPGLNLQTYSQGMFFYSTKLDVHKQ